MDNVDVAPQAGPDEYGQFGYVASVNQDDARVRHESYPMLPLFRRPWVVGFPVHRRYLDAPAIAVTIVDPDAKCRITNLAPQTTPKEVVEHA